MRIFCLVFALFLAAEAFGQSENFMLLSLKPQPEDFFAGLLEGNDPNFPAKTSSDYLVVGLINVASFTVTSIKNIAIRDATGRNLPLLVEKSSVYSEFGDKINSVRIGFAVSQECLEKGSLKLVWGDSVSGDTKEVESLRPHAGDRERYRSFSLEQRPAGDSSSSFSASINVIVDDYADKYYVWYLLPLVLIFGRRYQT